MPTIKFYKKIQILYKEALNIVLDVLFGEYRQSPQGFSHSKLNENQNYKNYLLFVFQLKNSQKFRLFSYITPAPFFQGPRQSPPLTANDSFYSLKYIALDFPIDKKFYTVV